jgi:hypothetical protein
VNGIVKRRNARTQGSCSGVVVLPCHTVRATAHLWKHAGAEEMRDPAGTSTVIRDRSGAEQANTSSSKQGQTMADLPTPTGSPKAW